MTLTDKQKQDIEKEAEQSQKEYFNGGCKDFQWVIYEDGYRAGASTHALACIQKDEEIGRLRAEIKELVENVNTLGRMQSDAMGRIVQLKKQLGLPHVHTNDLLDFFMGELWAYMTNLEGVHIGSNDLSKDQVMRFVFEQAKEIMAFLNYAGWCNSSFREGQTWEQFVDWQLDELNKDNTDPQRKEFIKKFIAKFNQTINP